MENILYTWLPRVFGCHCRKERSFHYKGKQFPICARCTGELAGILIGIPALFIWKPALPILVVLMVPMIADGFIQLCTKYESNNMRRFWTGLLFGYALITIIMLTSIWTFEYGRDIGNRFAGV